MTQPSEDIRVHRATPKYLNHLAELFDAYQQSYGRPSEPEQCRAFIAERFRANDTVVYLAILDAEPVGFVQLMPKLSSTSMCRDWILNDLFVTEPARRHGVARALIDEAKAFAQAAGASKITLKAHVDNTPAQTLYESHGWQRDHRFLTYILPIEELNPGSAPPET